jgi:ABC-2 type transport system permease protein
MADDGDAGVGLGRALGAELIKARRSVVPLITVVAFAVAGVVGGFFMFVLQDPQRARSLGLLGAKAQLAGQDADWAGYLALVAQIVSVGGLLVFGLLTIWLFGREFSDRTAKDLLALPTARWAIVAAKLTLGAAWSFLLAVELIALSLVAGTLLGLPGWTPGVGARGLGTVLAATALTICLTTGYGLAASAGRGYLPGVLTMFVTLFAAQVVAALGFGSWFPWSVPSLLSGTAGPDQASPGAASIACVVAVGFAAAIATGRWWERADHPV